MGDADAGDFLGRVLMAIAVAPADEGVPAHAAPGTGATWIECGRRPGYLHDRLDQLHEVAEAARAIGRKVTWG